MSKNDRACTAVRGRDICVCFEYLPSDVAHVSIARLSMRAGVHQEIDEPAGDCWVVFVIAIIR